MGKLKTRISINYTSHEPHKLFVQLLRLTTV